MEFSTFRTFFKAPLDNFFVVRSSNNVWLCAFVCLLICLSKKFVATSKQGRLRFGMLTVLTNVRSTKVLWQVEDDLRWKMTFGGRQHLAEDNLWLKTTFSGRWPLVEDRLRQKVILSGRRPSVKDDFWWKTILACCLVRFAAFFHVCVTVTDCNATACAKV